MHTHAPLYRGGIFSRGTENGNLSARSWTQATTTPKPSSTGRTCGSTRRTSSSRPMASARGDAGVCSSRGLFASRAGAAEPCSSSPPPRVGRRRLASLLKIGSSRESSNCRRPPRTGPAVDRTWRGRVACEVLQVAAINGSTRHHHAGSDPLQWVATRVATSTDVHSACALALAAKRIGAQRVQRNAVNYYTSRSSLRIEIAFREGFYCVTSHDVTPYLGVHRIY